MSGKPKAFPETFWGRVAKTETCWLWTGEVLQNGYGTLGLGTPPNRKRWLAHRLGYTLAFGEIPEGWLVCHCCDVRRCVRPDHLFLGTHKDNTRDMIRKGRMAPHVGKTLRGLPLTRPQSAGKVYR